MKLLALLLTLAVSASAGQTTMTVIADRTADAARAQPAIAGQPLAYVAYDGGYIEAGDPVAGEKLPSAELVRRELATVLNTAGYTPAVAPATPAILITYHWGSLRHDRNHIRRPYHIDPNLRARIALVAAPRTVKRAEDYFVGPPPPYVEQDLQDAFQLSRDPRYFVIVSAYRYGAADAGSTTPLWRTRLSVQTNAGAMDEAISSMLAASAPWLGQERTAPEHVKISLVKPAQLTGGDTAARMTDAAGQWVQTLARREHDEFAGQADPADRR